MSDPAASEIDETRESEEYPPKLTLEQRAAIRAKAIENLMKENSALRQKLKQGDPLIPPDRYDRELEKAAAILLGVLHVGKYKAIGLLEVAAGVQMLADEFKRQGERLAAAERLLNGCHPEHSAGSVVDIVRNHRTKKWYAWNYSLDTGADKSDEFDSPIDAYLAAVAANWLPAETAEAKGGE